MPFGLWNKFISLYWIFLFCTFINISSVFLVKAVCILENNLVFLFCSTCFLKCVVSQLFKNLLNTAISFHRVCLLELVLVEQRLHLFSTVLRAISSKIENRWFLLKNPGIIKKQKYLTNPLKRGIFRLGF